VTEEQRSSKRKATPPEGQERFRASGGVARSLQTHKGYARRSRLAIRPKLLLRDQLLFMRWLLSRFGERAAVRLTSGGPRLDEPSGTYDRFFSNFVLDLLPETDIEQVIEEAHRLLCPGGLLGLCSLTQGFTVVSRAIIWIWTRIGSIHPSLVAGCRPVDLRSFLPTARWLIQHHARVAPWGVPLEAVVAKRV
jgi:hypothetical protein